MAGLYVASLFLSSSPHRSLVVLEANDRVGGRVLDDETLIPGVRIGLGPSFLHGSERNIVVDLAKKHGWPLREMVWPDYVFFGSRPGCGNRAGRLGRLLSPDAVARDVEFQAMENAWELLGAVDPSTCENESVLTWLLEHGMPPTMASLANSIYGCDYGLSDLGECGLREVVLEQKAWRYVDSIGNNVFFYS